MMICGDSDDTFLIENVTRAKNLLEVPDECFHIVKEADHLPMLEKQEEVAQTIRTLICSHTTCILCVKKTVLSANTEVVESRSSAGGGEEPVEP